MTRLRKPGVHLSPELRDGALLADEHARPRTCYFGSERAAILSRRDGVDPEMAQRRELTLGNACHETAEPTPGNILEEHALDGVLCTEAEDLIALRLDEFLGHWAKNSRRTPRRLFAR